MEDFGEQKASQGRSMHIQLPSSNRPRHIKDKALLALPFISIFVGVDELVPTKAVYAIYDPTIPGLRFIHGDGLFIEPEQVCFTQSFSTGPAEYSSGQRQHLMELLKRSALHYQSINFGGSIPFEEDFKSPESVKAAFTFLSDIDFAVDYPALTKLDHNLVVNSVPGVPCLVLSSDPVWTFDPRLGFQPRVLREKEDKVKILLQEFNYKYGRNILLLDFLHAAFCLAGMEKAGLISWVPEGQIGESDESHEFRPRHTSAGWTVDCYLARFAKYEVIVERYGLGSYPNPIYWLEAELEDERRREGKGGDYRVGSPWKGMVDGKVISPVVDWKILKGFEWQEYPCSYPRPFVPLPERPLSLENIADNRANESEESEKAQIYGETTDARDEKSRGGRPRNEAASSPGRVQGNRNEDRKQLPLRKRNDTQLRGSSIGKNIPSTPRRVHKRESSHSPSDIASFNAASSKRYAKKRKRAKAMPSTPTRSSNHIIIISDDDEEGSSFVPTRKSDKNNKCRRLSPNLSLSPSQKRFKKPIDLTSLFPSSPTGKQKPASLEKGDIEKSPGSALKDSKQGQFRCYKAPTIEDDIESNKWEF